ncbi:MAG: hypothetical protein SFZ24_05195 [Planctomycetota bacterium]|nr:hypothetical protein [Planctomycetota bacterium]
MSSTRGPASELWRTAFLATGNRERSTRAVARVLALDPELTSMAAERRLTVLMQEAATGDAEAADALPGAEGADLKAWATLARLDRRQRAAWVVLNVQQTPEIAATRVLGIPKTALQAQADQAREALERALGADASGTGARLAALAAKIDPTSELEELERGQARTRRRRRLVAAAQFAAFGAFVVVLILIGRDLVSRSKDERSMRAIQEQLSLPMTDEQQRARERRLEEERRREQRGAPGGGVSP